MRLSVLAAASLLALGSGGAASATPSASMPNAAATTPIAMGCGAGRTRDTTGRCRHRFNLFRNPGRFHAYKDRHCDKVRTPNGSVNRCKI